MAAAVRAAAGYHPPIMLLTLTLYALRPVTPCVIAVPADKCQDLPPLYDCLGWAKYNDSKCIQLLNYGPVNYLEYMCKCGSDDSLGLPLPRCYNTAEETVLVIETEDELNFITREFNTSKSAWIGLNDILDECGTAQDMSCWTNGSSNYYSKWCDGEPDGTVDKDCVYLDGDCYRTSTCDVRRPRFCQREPYHHSYRHRQCAEQRAKQRAKQRARITIRPKQEWCYHAEEVVRVKDKVVLVEVKDLSVGDEVLVTGDDGTVHYDQVYSIPHRDLDRETLFTQIVARQTLATDSHDTGEERGVVRLRVTPDHMVVTVEGMQRAGDVTVGDQVYLYEPPPADSNQTTQSTGRLRAAQVINVTSVHLPGGVVAVFTHSGRLLVSDMLTSVYCLRSSTSQ